MLDYFEIKGRRGGGDLPHIRLVHALVSNLKVTVDVGSDGVCFREPPKLQFHHLQE